MIKVDLHLHSFVSRSNGDGIKWTSLYDAIFKLVENKVQIASFSDHNKLDVDFYLEAKQLAKTANILLLPAIEVNVVRLDGQIANIIYVFDQDLTKEELITISNIANKDIPKRGISLNKCNVIFNDFKTIKIPHVGKSDHFKYNDLLQIEYDAIEISNENDKNYLSVKKQEGFQSSIVAFSDTHKWNEYPQLKKLITIIPNMKEISFIELKKALSLNKDYTKGRIND
ncbi:MAG: hypothetical protein HDR43_01040 [Mycoplasma sp.]|nr:hypothetical protein [Mycoplasma sp.]